MKSTRTQPLPLDPGGKTSIPLPLWVRGSAVFGGPNLIYRYELSRSWNDQLPAMLFVGMNPSTADLSYDDPTIYKVRRYAEDWGFGTLLVGNVFAYRATDQKRLLEAADPVGPENNVHLLAMAARASLILMAYGTPRPALRSRGPKVASLLAGEHARKLHVLELSKFGVPKHPLYLKGNLKPIPWSPVPCRKDSRSQNFSQRTLRA